MTLCRWCESGGSNAFVHYKKSFLTSAFNLTSPVSLSLSLFILVICFFKSSPSLLSTSSNYALVPSLLTNYSVVILKIWGSVFSFSEMKRNFGLLNVILPVCVSVKCFDQKRETDISFDFS